MYFACQSIIFRTFWGKKKKFVFNFSRCVFLCVTRLFLKNILLILLQTLRSGPRGIYNSGHGLRNVRQIRIYEVCARKYKNYININIKPFNVHNSLYMYTLSSTLLTRWRISISNQLYRVSFLMQIHIPYPPQNWWMVIEVDLDMSSRLCRFTKFSLQDYWLAISDSKFLLVQVRIFFSIHTSSHP